ncbi:MAG: hypothetical protein KAS23_01075 [Anaerohalosphaera sp.]|nr:hypothetical protein [Anaerohalosphaera sp.]
MDWTINVYAGWLSMFLGCVAGAVVGMFFYKEDFLGGYTSWRRRMVRLGHISFFGIGIINILCGLTAKVLGWSEVPLLTSILLIVAAVAMPMVCYLSAIKGVFRHLFFVPAGSVMIAIAWFLSVIFGCDFF